MTVADQTLSRRLLAAIFRRPLRLVLWLGGLIVIVSVVQSCTWLLAPLGDKAAEAVFPNLATPPEMEAPPTFKQYPSSVITQAILGGRGRGLNCSIPSIGKSFFESPRQTASLSLHFRPSCEMHDLCYRHGYATYGYSQADCDHALQASAFRMCRQINKRTVDGVKVYDSCQTEAKKVLLGVSLGGAGSFQAGGRSTYFEYDPMPEKADNYVVGRAYPIDRAQALSGDLGVVAYRFFRNSVSAKLLKVDPDDPQRLLETISPPMPYPLQSVPTAPTYEWLGNGQSAMIALSRQTYSDTKLEQVRFLSMAEGNAPSLSLIPCPAPWRADRCSPDNDTSISKMANVEGRPMLVSLGHRSLGENKIPTVKVVRTDFTSTSQIEDYALNGDQSIPDRYRFLQNELLLEKDEQGYATHAWVLVRGMNIDPQNQRITANPDGQGYDTRLLVIRQALADGQAGKTRRFFIDAKETDDPLSLIRLRNGEGVALVGISWTENDLARLEGKEKNQHPPVLTVWRLPNAEPNGQQAFSPPERAFLSADLANGFLDRPPLIVNAPGHQSPIILWSRMSVPEPSKSEPKKTASSAFLDLKISSLDSKPNAEILGSVRCTLDLRKQFYSQGAGRVRVSARRENGNPEPPTADDLKRIEDSGMEELLNRWNMSQTIVSQRPSSESGLDDLTVTAVFNGYTSMSFQVVLKYDGSIFRFSKELPQSPYLSCEDFLPDNLSSQTAGM